MRKRSQKAQRRFASTESFAEFVLAEVKATLLWHFEDGETSDEDIVLAQLAETHGSAQSHDGIAAALFDYAELADRDRDNLDGLGSFDLALIEGSTATRRHTAAVSPRRTQRVEDGS